MRRGSAGAARFLRRNSSARATTCARPGHLLARDCDARRAPAGPSCGAVAITVRATSCGTLLERAPEHPFHAIEHGVEAVARNDERPCPLGDRGRFFRTV